MATTRASKEQRFCAKNATSRAKHLLLVGGKPKRLKQRLLAHELVEHAVERGPVLQPHEVRHPDALLRARRSGEDEPDLFIGNNEHRVARFVVGDRCLENGSKRMASPAQADIFRRFTTFAQVIFAARRLLRLYCVKKWYNLIFAVKNRLGVFLEVNTHSVPFAKGSFLSSGTRALRQPA